MDKPIITQEQADAIEERKRINMLDGSVKCHIKYKWRGETNKSLNKLSLDEFIRALYIGYEVEPEYKENEWVRVSWSNDNPTTHKVTGPIKHGGLEIDGDQRNKRPGLNVIRHATPEEITKEKERRWWAKHDRDVWEIKEGDIVVCPREQSYTVERVSSGVVVFKEGSDKYIRDVRNEYKIICFAEDRKDV